MEASRLLTAALVLAGVFLLWKQENAAGQGNVAASSGAIDYGNFLGDAVDTIAETVTVYTGVDMPSSRFQRAANDPANARIVGLLQAAELRNGIPAGLLVRQAWQESRFNPNAVNAASGAQGLMQFMPATAQEWGVDPFDAASAADGAGRYMQWLYGKTGSWTLALAAYNWGIGNVLRRGIAAAPAETQNYMAQIGADVGLA